MNEQAVSAVPIRALVEPSHPDGHAVSAAETACSSAGSAVHIRRLNPRDPFVDLVTARPSREVNPHLWSWQAEALDAWHQAGCRGVVEAVTGAGKTMIGITAAFEAFRQSVKVLVLVPTAELQAQWQQKLLETLPQAAVGTLGNGRHDSLHNCDILVAIINSATRESLLQEYSQGLLIADECHRYAAATFAKALRSEFAYRLGLTATYKRPDDADQRVLDPYFGGVVFQLWYDRALADGVIAQFDIAFVGVSLTDSERGMYQQASAAVSKLGMTLKTKLQLQEASFDRFMRSVQRLSLQKHDRSPLAFMARKYLEAVVKRQNVLTNAENKLSVLDGIAPVIAESRGTLVFSQTVDASYEAAELLKRVGIEARAVSSDSKAHERRGAMQLFAGGIAKVLCAPRILDEGIDVPDSDLAVVLSGSKQPRQTIQRLGRVIRRKPNSRHGRFVVLYARDTIEDNSRNRQQQFGPILPSARRTADFDQTEIRELRRFLRATGPEHQESSVEAGQADGEPSMHDAPVQASIALGPATPVSHDERQPSDVVPRVVEDETVRIVLRKDVDDNEPDELLGSIPDPDDLVKLYLNQIGQSPLLTAEQEVELAQRVEAGLYADRLLKLQRHSTRRERHNLEGVSAEGREAFDRMVSSNLRLVVSIAKRYGGWRMELLDCVQEGSLGLVRAVQKFDYAKGVKFSTYATWWIRQAITRGIADQSNTIRIPVHLVEKFPAYWNCTADDDARQACTHDHSNEERALRMQPMSLDSYLELQWSTHYAESSRSLDDRIVVGDYFTEDPGGRVIEDEFMEIVNRLVDSLTVRDAEVLRLRFGWYGDEPATLDMIGKKFYVTRERIRQIVNNSLKSLRPRADVLFGRGILPAASSADEAPVDPRKQRRVQAS